MALSLVHIKFISFARDSIGNTEPLCSLLMHDGIVTFRFLNGDWNKAMLLAVGFFPNAEPRRCCIFRMLFSTIEISPFSKKYNVKSSLLWWLSSSSLELLLFLFPDPMVGLFAGQILCIKLVPRVTWIAGILNISMVAIRFQFNH